MRRDTEIAEKLIFVPCFQNQACSKLNTSLILEPNAQKLYNNILSHIFTFSLGKRVHYQCYQNPPLGILTVSAEFVDDVEDRLATHEIPVEQSVFECLAFSEEPETGGQQVELSIRKLD